VAPLGSALLFPLMPSGGARGCRSSQRQDEGGGGGAEAEEVAWNRSAPQSREGEGPRGPTTCRLERAAAAARRTAVGAGRRRPAAAAELTGRAEEGSRRVGGATAGTSPRVGWESADG
jgi:hypothetical protein